MCHRIIATAGAIWLLAFSALCQPPDTEAEPAPAGAPIAPVPVEVAPITLEFPGGLVADLCAVRGALLGVRTVPLRGYERILPPVSWTSDSADRVNPVPQPLASNTLGLSEARPRHALELDMHLARTVRLGVLPGWLLEPSGGSDPAPPRSLRSVRDDEVIPFIDFRANPIGLPELREQLVAYSRLPIVLAEGVQLRDERFPVYAQGIPVSEAIGALAEAAGLRAVPVDVAFDLEADFADYLTCVSDTEVLAQTQLLTLWDGMAEEEKQGLLDSLLDQYKRLPEPRRAEVRRILDSVIGGVQARLQELGPQEAEGVSASLGRLNADLVQWYAGLGPEDRGELSGLFGTMNSLFGGPRR